MTTAGDRLLDSLDVQQRAAVESRARTLFVLAGPGSGKTSTLTARLIHLLERRQVPSHQVACFVFSRAAAAEVRARVVAAVGEQRAELLTVSTFHAFAMRILRACAHGYLALGGWPAGDAWRVADDQEADEALRGIFDGPERRPEASRTGISAVRAASVSHAAYGRWGSGPEWSLLSLWWKRLAERGLVTHDRLIPAAWEALGDDDRAQQVVGNLRHVLIDEAQDLTLMEQRLATTRRGVTAPAVEVTYVGDARQAIFGWRGANAFEDLVEGRHGAEGVETVFLTSSYRCRAEIATYANALGNALRAPGQPIVAAPGASAVLQGIERARLRALVWEQVTVLGAANVAVLARTNREAEQAASDLGDLARLIRREPDEALRVGIAAVRLHCNRNDNASARILLRAIGTSDETLTSLEVHAGLARGLWVQAVEQGFAQGEPIAVLPEDAKRALDVALGGQTSAAERGYWMCQTGEEVLDALGELQEADLIAQARADGKVVVSTVHGAKGCEWDSVVVLTSRDWPGPRPKPDELRVLFVAITRARSALAVLEE